MRLTVAADRAGHVLKLAVLDLPRSAGHHIVDLGIHDPSQADDYPDLAQLACEAVRRGAADRAVVVCDSAVGVSVASNKFAGIRAGLCQDPASAREGVEEDDMNVLCLGARRVGPEEARRIAGAFASARFRESETPARRLENPPFETGCLGTGLRAPAPARA